MYLLDQTWLPFSNLMLKRIYTVLLICSDYDRFMLEEDGRVEEELYKEYTDLGLSNPPKITHVSNEEQALNILETNNFDLVISMLDLGTGRVEKLAEDIKKLHPNLPVIALSPSPDHRVAKELKGEDCPYIDYLFYWLGSSEVFLAMIKLVEDKLNLEHDTSVADVQVIVLVEDSVRFTSIYLPYLYTELIHQARNSIGEGLNEWGKTLRMRGRPKIALAKTYDEGWELYRKYKQNVLGVITDVSYPSPWGKEAGGLKLAENVKKDNPECPVLVQSTDIKYQKDAYSMGCDFIWKQSDGLMQELDKYFIKEYNFGPFLFIDPKTGKTITQARNVKDVQEILKILPEDSFLHHIARNDISRWLRAQSLYTLASMIKPIVLHKGESPDVVRQKLYDTIKSYRAERARSSIAEFSKDNYDETLFFSRMGKGSLGGKGRGLAFIAMEMHAHKLRDEFPEIYLSIPRTIVISTEYFDRFMKENALDSLYFASLDDEAILRLFLSKKLPDKLRENLIEVLNVIKVPISVRSSSLLEDSHYQPFAGVYQTSMIPNNGDFDKRLRELEMAVKTVWASTYFETAKEYLKRTGHSLDEEKMAVILQQVTGSEHFGYWFPNISGVARSLNYYPTQGQKSEDGVGMLSFGFGKIIVDEGTAFRFCPGKPKKPANDLMKEGSDQRTFYALDMNMPFDPLSNSDNLVKLDLDAASKWPKSLRGIASTIDPLTGVMSESVMSDGIKTITFNGILKYDMLPVAKVIHKVLTLGSEAMAEPVEIEIAVNTERTTKKPDFSILQIRPISNSPEFSDVSIKESEKESALLYSKKIMGNGKIKTIRDAVIIKPESFEISKMRDMAKELDEFNRNIESEYLLIATGRLGSSDPWLGIPCTWSNISKARVIVEMGLKDLQVEPSEGTHFFQNMTSLGCIYLTINPVFSDGRINLDEIRSYEKIRESEHFVHVRKSEPFIVKANGLSGEAVILKGEENDN